jgi:alpha-tubulin suppressor-like RCC1 family protein
MSTPRIGPAPSERARRTPRPVHCTLLFLSISCGGAKSSVLAIDASSDTNGTSVEAGHDGGAAPDSSRQDGSMSDEGGADAPSKLTVKAISAGENHTCALISNGTVKCWGDNSWGQLGIGNDNGPDTCVFGGCATTAVEVPGLHGVIAIASGYSHTCAVLASGSVECWGRNSFGELGSGPIGHETCTLNVPCSTTPVAVSGLTSAKSLAAGQIHTCALLNAGTVECWGDNSVGDLGLGMATGPETCDEDPCSTTPVAVPGLKDVAAISAWNIDTCAVLSSGSALCWGFNTNGELGVGTSTGPDSCGTGSESTPCATSPTPISMLKSVETIAPGEQSVCAVVPGGTVACWGDGSIGELGIGSSPAPDSCGGFPCATSPVGVPGLSGVKAVSVGDVACALLEDGTVDCWGENVVGQIGDGTSTGPEQCGSGSDATACAASPVKVTGLSDAVAISAGLEHVCAIRSGGAVVCWGYNTAGQLGTGSISGPEHCGGSGANTACSTTPIAVVGL